MSSQVEAFSQVEWLTKVRSTEPNRLAEALAKRKRRPKVIGDRGTLFLIAADHTARGQHRVGDDGTAMADRNDLLTRLRLALQRHNVDGVMGTADIIEDLALLGALEDKVVFGSMNRGGLDGSVFELDDRFTGYTAAGIKRAGLDGGKMMVRIADDDSRTVETLRSCALAIDELADQGLPAMVEVFSVSRREGLVVDDDPARLARAVTVASGLGSTSSYTWLKVPVVQDIGRVIAATTLPVFLLGGDPGRDVAETYRRWERAMAFPQVRGLVVGRAVLYPPDGNVAQAVDTAATIVSGG
jgi:Cgl0159-like